MTLHRSLPFALLTLSLSACWPYLGDPYESYVDGSSDSSDVGDDELHLVGQVTWTEQRGTYWGEDSVDRELVGGVGIVYLVDGGSRSALARFAGGDGTCRPVSDVDDLYDNAIDASETGNIVLDGRTDVTLPWLEDSNFWAASIEAGTSLGHAGSYDLEVVQTGFGDMGGVELFSTPRALSITNPIMSGSTPPDVGRDGIRLTWSNQANAVIMGFTTVDSEGDVMDSIYCGVTSASDSFTLTLDDLPSLAFANYTVVEMGNVSNGTGTVADGITNDVAAIHWQVGAVVHGGAAR